MQKTFKSRRISFSFLAIFLALGACRKGAGPIVPIPENGQSQAGEGEGISNSGQKQPSNPASPAENPSSKPAMPSPDPNTQPAPRPNPTPTPAPTTTPSPAPSNGSVCATSPQVNQSIPYEYDPSCTTQGGIGCVADLPCRYKQ